jgi:hypothetical protein
MVTRHGTDAVLPGPCSNDRRAAASDLSVAKLIRAGRSPVGDCGDLLPGRS